MGTPVHALLFHSLPGRDADRGHHRDPERHAAVDQRGGARQERGSGTAAGGGNCGGREAVMRATVQTTGIGRVRPMITISRVLRVLAAAGLLAWGAGAVSAAEEETKIERQQWPFSGLFGQFDQAQLQRGYQVYSEVCSNCHELNRIYFRNLAQPAGPAFPEDSVKALAAGTKGGDGPHGNGQKVQRAGPLS